MSSLSTTKTIAIGSAASCLCVGILLFFPVLPLLVAFVIGIIATVILPGLLWSFVIFPRSNLSLFERTMIGIVCSFALVAITAFCMNSFVRVALSRTALAVDVLILSLVGATTAFLIQKRIVHKLHYEH